MLPPEMTYMDITSRTIAALELPADKSDAIFFDDDLVGFGIRLRRGPDGKVRRSYVVQYRHAGRSRRVRIARAEVMSADKARGEARKILESVALGRDALAEKAARKAKDAHTLASVAADYLSTKEKRVRPRTLYESRRYLTGAYFKSLHNTPVDRITRRDVAIRVMAIARDQGSVAAGHARTTLSATFAWAIAAGLCEHNPVVGSISPEGAARRDHVLSDAELAAVWRVCKDDDYSRIVQLLILTAQRRGEVGGMRWSELSGNDWVIPASRAKNGKEHVVPLAPMALRIIENTTRWVGRDWLFGTSAEGYRTWSAGKLDFDRRCGVAGWTIHDLRRTSATKMADLGVPPHVIETVLNHVSGHKSGVAGIYNRSRYEGEVRQALERWASHIEKLVA
jgi:integrase